MDHEEAVATFCGLTGANDTIAVHVLEAHGWSLDEAVSFFLDSGGVGFGAPALPASPPDLIEEPEEDQATAREAGPASAPLPAAARPRSSPIEVRRTCSEKGRCTG